jgi:hypothetical protein
MNRTKTFRRFAEALERKRRQGIMKKPVHSCGM